MATIIVRWQMKRYVPNYDPKAVKYLLSGFGAIRDIKTLGPNSCIVTFENLTSACNVVESKNIGHVKNKLICSWWHKFMDNKNMIVRSRGVEIRPDLYRPFKSGW